MRTFASIFSGCGGADEGARLAGYKPIWGVEYDSAIAGAGRLNGFDFMVQDMRAVNYAALESPDWLHASFVCERFSIANPNAGETHEDVSTAQTFIKAVHLLKPEFISVENVRAYQRSDSFKLVVQGLEEAGYRTVWGVLNAADYGTPQTRKRLILAASRVSIPVLPAPVFSRARWIGWQEAVKGLELARRKPVKWVQDRLGEYHGTCLIDARNARGKHGKLTILPPANPAFTLVATNSLYRYPIIKDGEWYQATSRCLARWQGFNDSFVLPDNDKLAAFVIGNSVPPPLMRAVIRAQFTAQEEAA